MNTFYIIGTMFVVFYQANTSVMNVEESMNNSGSDKFE